MWSTRSALRRAFLNMFYDERSLRMPLAERLSEFIRACFTGIWIESHEHAEAVVEIARLCRAEQWRMVTWDIDAGLQISGTTEANATAQDPLAAIRALSALGTSDGTAILVLQNFHRFLASAEIIQAVARQVTAGKHQRTFVVILAPVVQLPPELEKLFVVIEHDLPTKEQLADIAQGVATEADELPAGDALQAVLDGAAGLTRHEAENAFSLSLVRHGRLEAPVLWELKSQMLKKSGLLALHRGGETFAGLGGLDNLKAFCLRAMRRSSGTNHAVRPHGIRPHGVRPRGVLLLSPPGCGKSQFAKALGNEVGRPALTLDVGSLLGSLVGQSEQNVRQALKIVDAMAPCVLFCDELEKGLSGVAASGNTDSGVSARLFGSLLTWLNDHESDVFFVGTCNDISKLPPEFARAERFDGVFFVDLPTSEQRQAIWRIYLNQFGLDPRQAKPNDGDWTGAEIRSCCRLAALLDVPLVQAAQNVVPVARTAAESIGRLRSWASGRCLSADRPGIYSGPGTAESNSRRRVQRNPSDN
jgi:hypothetical protein